jgi:acyl carrier protein
LIEIRTGKMPVEMSDICKTVGLVLGCRNVVAANRLAEDLAAESADILNLVATVEEKYGISIDDADIPSVRTVADLHDLVCRCVA